MVEQWFVQLKDQFQAAQMSLGKLIEKLDRGEFFSPEDFSEMASVLETQRHLQEQCIEQLSQRELISSEDGKDMSLQRLETLVRQAGEREALEEKSGACGSWSACLRRCRRKIPLIARI